MCTEEVERVGQALLSIAANGLSIPQALSLAVLAGLDGTVITKLTYKRVGMGSRAVMIPAILGAWSELSPAAKVRALPILGERLLRANAPHADEARNLLVRHGFRFIDGAFVRLNDADERERLFLPPQAYDEITKAIGRLSDGDESGAITSACGAIDALMQYIYGKYDLGNPGTTAFAAKVNTAIKRLTVFETMQTELVSLGMKPHDVKAIIENTRDATKCATDALQVLRRSMGDAHGTKPALRKTAYDALKWSSAICALFDGF